MVNQLKWIRPYQIALTIFVALGAIAGVACGYHIADWTWGGPGSWAIKRSDNAVGWATFGAIVAGIVVHGALAIPRLRWGRSTAGAAPQRPRGRTHPPRPDATSSTSSRRRKERTGRVSLQQALHGTGNTSWRA